jgi:hypothetical protein
MHAITLSLFFVSFLHGAAVTYEVSSGRFGDNLLCYIHAKWIAYTYGIPLLYKPFVYSDQLRLDTSEIHYTPEKEKCYTKVEWIKGRGTPLSVDSSSSTLYVVPYFPDSAWEQQHCISFAGGKWDYFCVDWEDQAFIQELNRCITPKQELECVELPSDRITVAAHVRRGGNHDTSSTFQGFPLKFLPDEFFIEAIRNLYTYFKEPLYVHLFTDDNNPLELLEYYRSALFEYDIQWGCREMGNSDTSYVIEDFFAMKQFDCLIHSESNYSYLVSKLGTYLTSLYPAQVEQCGVTKRYSTIKVHCSHLPCDKDEHELYRMFCIPASYNSSDPYNSYYPVLQHYLRSTSGTVIEFGSSQVSTSLLHEMCRMMGRKLITIDDDFERILFFRQLYAGDGYRPYNDGWHQLYYVSGKYDDHDHHHWIEFFDSVPELIEQEFSICFIDQSPWLARYETLKRFKSISQYVILHDCNYFPEQQIFGTIVEPLVRKIQSPGVFDFSDELSSFYVYYPSRPWPFETGPPTLVGSILRDIEVHKDLVFKEACSEA